jgi:alpha-glucosidase
VKRKTGDKKGLENVDLLYPKYSIANRAAYRTSWNGKEGGLSNKTVNTDVMSSNGIAQYYSHNLYGSMMSETPPLFLV